MKTIKIALVQMKCEKADIDANLGSIKKYTKECKNHGADIVCFPEMSITGYIDPVQNPEKLLNIESNAVKYILSLSKRYEILITAGFIEKSHDIKPYITQIAAYDGMIKTIYRKITIADDETQWFIAGGRIATFTYNDIKMGLSICADINNEKLFSYLAASGAKIVFESAAPGLYGEQKTRNWQSGFDWWKNECHTKLGKYAKDNEIYIAVSTQAGRTVDEDFPGGGYVFSKDGECIAESKDWHEGILYDTLCFE